MKDFMQISNFIDINVLQNIQDNISKATGFSFVTVDLKGHPVTRQSGFTHFCINCRKIEKFKERCHKCDAYGGVLAAITGKPKIYICHAGLIDFAVPLTVGDTYIGAILGGQISLPKGEKNTLNKILGNLSDFTEYPELIKYKNEICEIPFDKISSAASMMHEISNYIVEKEYINRINEELHTKNMKLIEEEAKRSDLEKSLKEMELKALYYQISPNFLFNVLNTIARMAYTEKAHNTEKIIYEFSDMMRYILKRNKSQLVTLKEEIQHTCNYLAIQKVRMQDKLIYNIDIPEKYYSVLCPFLVLQPIVENSIKYVVEAKSEGGIINIRAFEKDSSLIIEVHDNGSGISKAKAKSILIDNAYKSDNGSPIGLYNINHRLNCCFGEKYGLTIKNSEEKQCDGTTIFITIPLHSSLKL